jgi:large subunit ribosomal protein L30
MTSFSKGYLIMAKETKKLKIVQTGSPIGRNEVQRRILIGLGLNKLHRERELDDTPAIRGMITKVAHLVKVTSDKAA